MRDRIKALKAERDRYKEAWEAVERRLVVAEDDCETDEAVEDVLWGLLRDYPEIKAALQEKAP